MGEDALSRKGSPRAGATSAAGDGDHNSGIPSFVARDWRDDRIEQLLAQNAALMAQVEKLTARVAELEGRWWRLGAGSRAAPISYRRA